MPLVTLTPEQLLQRAVAAYEAGTGTTFSPPDGDPILALIEVAIGLGMYHQGLNQQVFLNSRGATSEGADLDTFFADFHFQRDPATFATGPVVLSVISPHTFPVSIPAGVGAVGSTPPSGNGMVVQTPGGAIQYMVIADPNQPSFVESQNAYVLNASATTLVATAQALVAGSQYNVQAGQLTQIASLVPGIDTVYNNAGIVNGFDAESDDASYGRFPLYLNGLSKGTLAAILSAIASVQQGLTSNVLENETNTAVAAPGTFTVVLDDGSGSPPSSLISTTLAALNGVRAFCVQAACVAPVLVTATISLAVRIATGYTTSVVEGIVQNAVAGYINSLPVAATAYLNRITQVAVDSTPGVVSVQPGTVLLNSSAADLVATQDQVIRTSTTSITVSTY